MSVKVQKIVDPLLLGEAPHWDSQQQALFFVDIPQGIIHKYVPSTRVHTKTKLEDRLGFIVPVEGTTNQFIVGYKRTFRVIEWNGEDNGHVKTVRDLYTVDRGVEPPNNLNDGKADPRGRLYAGTLGHQDSEGNILPKKGSLFRIDRNGLTKLASDIGISNGLTWDVKEKAFYYIDSHERKIRRYDYDVDTGDISNMTYIFDFQKNKVDGHPDGCTLDTDGNLWVAVFNGSCVLKINPKSGKLLQNVPIPALQVTSVAFGGPDLDILYVTSGSLPLNGPQDSPCGCTFMVTGLGVKGYPNLNFKLH